MVFVDMFTDLVFVYLFILPLRPFPQLLHCDLQTHCGTDGFMAPEVILSAANHEAYDSLVDSYSIGVVVFCMCVRFFYYICISTPQ